MKNVYDFNSLCAPCYDELLHYVVKRTRDKQKAEDIVQDTMVRAYSAWDRWQPKEGLEPWAAARAWLYRLASNLFKTDFVRDKHYASLIGGTRVLSDDADSKRVFLTTTQHQVAAELYQGLPEDQALGDEVTEALDRIKPEWAEVVKLAYIDDMTEHEIAAALNIPRGTARSRMARGRMALARILGPSASKWGFDKATTTASVETLDNMGCTYDAPMADEEQAYG